MKIHSGTLLLFLTAILLTGMMAEKNRRGKSISGQRFNVCQLRTGR